MVAPKKETKKLLNEASFRKMRIMSGLLTEAEADKMAEDELKEAEIAEGEEVVTEETSELTAKKPKEDPSTKDAKGTDKVAKSIKGGPSAKLEKVAKPTFSKGALKEGFPGQEPEQDQLPPDAGADTGGFGGGEPDGDEFGDDLGMDDDMGGGDKLTVDADGFANDLASGLSMALQKHFGNKLSVTAGGAPAGDLGSEGGEFEPASESDLGGAPDMGGLPDEMGAEGGQPPSPGLSAPPKAPGLPPEEEKRMQEAKKAKLMESMVEKIMKQILKK